MKWRMGIPGIAYYLRDTYSNGTDGNLGKLVGFYNNL